MGRPAILTNYKNKQNESIHIKTLQQNGMEREALMSVIFVTPTNIQQKESLKTN